MSDVATFEAPHGRVRSQAHGCGCPRCFAAQRERMLDRLTRDSLRIALRHAQFESGLDASEARPTGFLKPAHAIPNTSFSVSWSDPRSLTDIRSARPGELKRRGQQQVYAFLKKGSKRPLYLGHVHGKQQSVLKRLQEHLSGSTAGGTSSATRRLTDEINKHLKDIYVQVGTYSAPGYTPTPNMTRVIEGLLQQQLTPRFWDRTVTTFEQEEDLLWEGDA